MPAEFLGNLLQSGSRTAWLCSGIKQASPSLCPQLGTSILPDFIRGSWKCLGRGVKRRSLEGPAGDTPPALDSPFPSFLFSFLILVAGQLLQLGQGLDSATISSPSSSSLCFLRSGVDSLCPKTEEEERGGKHQKRISRRFSPSTLDCFGSISALFSLKENPESSRGPPWHQSVPCP